MDEVRQALGDDKLTYVGYSYGTSIGEQYADLFPTQHPGHGARRCRRQRAQRTAGGRGAGRRASSGRSTRFLDDCASTSRRASSAGSPGTRRRPGHRLGREADRSLLRTPTGRRRPASSSSRSAKALYSENLWPDLASALARRGRRRRQRARRRSPTTTCSAGRTATYPNVFEIYFAVNCLDSTWPTRPRCDLRRGQGCRARRDPRWAKVCVNDYVRCALWPAPPQPLPSRSPRPGSPPILVISTTGDPATPYASGVAVAKRLPQGVLLTNVGDGHTVVRARQAVRRRRGRRRTSSTSTRRRTGCAARERVDGPRPGPSAEQRVRSARRPPSVRA